MKREKSHKERKIVLFCDYNSGSNRYHKNVAFDNVRTLFTISSWEVFLNELKY